MPFYNIELEKANAIYAPTYQLTEDNHSLFEYPYEGWVYADTPEKAGKIHGLKPKQIKDILAKQAEDAKKEAEERRNSTRNRPLRRRPEDITGEI